MRTTRRGRRGSEAVEFALVLPVFLSITLGGIEFMWFMSMVAALHTSVRTGARAGAVSATESVVTNAQTQAQATWDAYGNVNATANFTATTVGSAPNLEVQVTGTMAYTSLTGMMPGLLLPPSVTRTVRMHLEDQVP